ncbi:MAG: TonB-dependent receptor [Lysobacterales bacterium]
MPWSRSLCALALTLSSLSAQAEAPLPEITVTAQKREESLQRAPLAVTALTPEALDALAITHIGDLSTYAPNTTVTPTVGGSVNAAINIRGAGSAVNNLSRDAAVGVYLDGVPIAKAAGAIFDVTDLQRIEVLRGPQGTLYGKNTIGGAINLISQAPSGEYAGTLTLGAGSEHLRSLRAHLDSAAIGEVGVGAGRFASRWSYVRTLRDGYVQNLHPSTPDFDNRDQWAGRLDLDWQWSERLRARYAQDRFDLDQRPTALQIVEFGSYATLPVFGSIAGAAYSPRRRDAIANEASRQSAVAIRGDTLTLDYALGSAAGLDEMALKYIGARRVLATDSQTDFDGTAADFSRFGLYNDYVQHSHELQWSARNERLSLVGGLFRLDDDWRTDNPRWNAQILRGNDGVYEINQRGAQDRSGAIYGQLDWRASERWTLGLGLRRTVEEKAVYRLRVTDGLRRGTLNASNPASGVFLRDASGQALLDGAGQYQPLSARRRFAESTPMLVASYGFNADWLAYLRLASGFKSGGYNDVASTNAEFLQGFDAERMRTLELGLKASVGNGRVQLRGAVFDNDYRDYQADVYIPEALGIGVQNAARAHARGLELEVDALLGEAFEYTLSYGYLDFQFDRYLTPDVNDLNQNGNRSEIIDVADRRVVPYNPRHTLSSGLQYRRELPFATLRARLDYQFRGSHVFAADPATALRSPAYGLWNARLSLADIELGDGKVLGIDLWGRNLLNREYLVSGLVFASGLSRGMAVATFGDPRSVGLDVRVAW